jgi:hypothetical protein
MGAIVLSNMVGYYDAVLGLIPLSLLGVTGGLTVGGVTLTAAVSLGAAVALLLVVHALFVRTPTQYPLE